VITTLDNLAIKKALAGHWDEAIELNQKILKDEPENVDALNRLARALAQKGQIKKAQKTYRKVLKFDRFNPIAKRNLEKLKKTKKANAAPLDQNPDNFLEEPGKTKVVPLVRLGSQENLLSLNPSQPLVLEPKTKSISLYTKEGQYVGRLPDDLSLKLSWLINRGNRYKVFVKVVEKNRVLIFIRETKRSKRNKNYPSFSSSGSKTTYLPTAVINEKSEE